MARTVQDLLIQGDGDNFVDTSDEEVIFTPAESGMAANSRRTPGRDMAPVNHIARARSSPTRIIRDGTPRYEREPMNHNRDRMNGGVGLGGGGEDRDSYKDGNGDRTRFPSATPTLSNASTVRRRSTPKSSRKLGSHKMAEPTKENDFQNATIDAVIQGLKWTASFALEILGTTLKIIKYPLSLIIGLWILMVLSSISYNYLAGSLRLAFTPICKIPGANRLDLPFCKPMKDSPAPDYPQLIELQNNFEKVLESSLGGSSLAMDMKQSEVAIRDLSTLVKMSQLLCRDQLHRHLDEFSSSAKLASRELQKLGSRVGGTVDAILAMDEWALRSLEDIERREQIGSGPKIINALIPFRSELNSRKDIEATFAHSSQLMDNHIQRLILEAETVLRKLDELENKLDVIHEVVSREDMHIKAEHDEVLADLFTFLGGNKKRLSYFQQHRTLLSNIAVYRSRALAYVSSTLIQLQQMSSDLEDLRERVVAPALLADVVDIPLEVHIASVRKGIERLNLGKSKARDKEQESLRMLLSKHDEAVAAIGLMDAAAKETAGNLKK